MQIAPRVLLASAALSLSSCRHDERRSPAVVPAAAAAARVSAPSLEPGSSDGGAVDDGAADDGADADAAPLAEAPGGGWVFPLDVAAKRPLSLSRFDAPGCTGTFGASRSPGRVHAGCDLYFTDDGGDAYKDAYFKLNRRTPIRAVQGGTIVEYAPFYAGTFALVVDHGGFVARYGEVSAAGLPDDLRVGSTVKAGQHIADMGDLQMGAGGWAMLHFELYAATRKGPLTDSNTHAYAHVPRASYQRRADLLDCRPFLRAIAEGRAPAPPLPSD